MEARHYLTVGDRLGEITLPDLDGNDFSTTMFAGKKYIIFMWASW